ncbi:MAG TPA: dTDP-4-dehydrorhamnose 3,5-epimerase [Spirochaetota bacterium]|nr:dTDP-4-dehydrorhamnose 3,5-epimerase [Spirochaetota bacterium]
MPSTFKRLEIPEVILVSPKAFFDERGFFIESYKESEFIANGITEKFVQDNHSLSKKGVIRALHYQLNPKAQGKLVRVVTGSVFDVAVDIRKSSPTFLKCIRVELSDKNNDMLYIPPGFAHGFVALTDNVNLLYKCTNEYDKASERGIRYDDPQINVNWGVSNPIVSDKDKILPYLKDAEIFN